MNPPHHYRRQLLLWLDNALSGRAPRRPLPEKIHSILVLIQEKLGDAVLLIPLFNQLRETFPRIRIDVLCSRYNRPFLEGLPMISATVPYRGDYRLLIQHLRHNSYDVFYNHKDHPSITANRLAQRVRAEVRVCLSHPRHNQYYNHILPNRDNAPHIIEKNVELLRHYGVPFPLPNHLPVPPSAAERAATLIHPADKWKTISANLSSGGKYRCWPRESWSELFRHIFVTYHDTQILLFAMPPESGDAQYLKDAYGDQVVYPLPTRDLFDAAAFIKQSSVLISPDTSLVHVAAATGVAVTGLYINDDRSVRLFAPYGVPHRIVRSDSLTLETIPRSAVIEAFDDLIESLDISRDVSRR